jgi:hypothetical protein
MESGELPLGSHQPTLHERLVLPAPTAGEEGMVSKSGGVAPRLTKRGSAFTELASSALEICQFEKLV